MHTHLKNHQQNWHKISHSILIKLQGIYDSLKKAERRAADFLLADPQFVSSASIVEVATKAKCSEATLVRLAKKLGYEGYSELKAAILEGNTSQPIKIYQDISEADDYGTIVKKVFQASIQALTDTLEVLDVKEYERAVEALMSAGKVVFYGVGDAATVALSGYQKFIRVGIEAQVASDPDLQLITASHLKKGDVAIAISHSGRSRSVVNAVKRARLAGASTICITNFPFSPLAKNSDIQLITAAFVEHLNGEVISKRVAELCILESLYVGLLMKRAGELEPNLRRSNIAIEINKI